MEPDQEVSTTENKAGKGKPPKPPEEDFYGGNAKPSALGMLKDVLRKKRTRYVLFSAAFLMAVLLLASLTSGRHRAPGAVDEKKKESKAVFTAAEMNEAILASAKAGKRNAPVRGKRSGAKERKLSTDIAVFIKEEEREKRRRGIGERSEELRLGLPAGTVIPAFLKQNVLSFNVITPVIAEVTEDVTRDGHVLIPKGSRFIGEAQVVKTLDRINVSFHRLVFASGGEVFGEDEELRVRALAQSPGGPGGIAGLVDKHTDRKVFKAIGKSLIAGASLFVGGKSQDPYALEDQLRYNVAQNLTDEAARDLREVKVEKSITVDAFESIEVVLLEAI